MVYDVSDLIKCFPLLLYFLSAKGSDAKDSDQETIVLDCSLGHS